MSMKSTSLSLKRLDSLLHYLSKTGEQQPSPKRKKATVESEESESETETRPNTGNSSASAVTTADQCGQKTAYMYYCYKNNCQLCSLH